MVTRKKLQLSAIVSVLAILLIGSIFFVDQKVQERPFGVNSYAPDGEDATGMPLERSIQELGPEGGEVSVKSGSIIFFDSAVLTSPTRVLLETYTEPHVGYSPGVVPIAPLTKIALPYNALNTGSDGSIHIGVPAEKNAQDGNFLAEVSIRLADGSFFTYAKTYHPTDENLISLSVQTLKVLFETHEAAPETLEVMIQPLDYRRESTGN